MTNFFDDFADDLEALEAENAVAVQQEQTFRVPCEKCQGRGKFISYTGRVVGDCFACKGRGYHERRHSAEQLQQNRAKAAQRRANSADANWTGFAERHPNVAGWIEGKSPTFEFAQSLYEAVRKFGDLTERQLAAAQKCLDSDTARQQARQQRIESAPVVDCTALEQAFEKAGDRAKLRFEHVVISRAPVTGRNAGSLYVKARDESRTYLGKITAGKFYASRDCSDDAAAEVATVVADPKAAAIAYGQRTGTCCICGRELTNEGSVELGVGPVCASKFGW